MRKKRGKCSYRSLKLLVLLLLIIVTAALGCSLGSNQKEDSTQELAVTKDRIEYVMLLGVDRRAGDTGRSDTMMITALDFDKEKAALLSVPRDTRVNIDGYGYEKINHAYAYGGHKLSQKTVEELLGVSMTHYIIIDTKAFQRIIDAIGGVDINVEKRMYYEDPWDDNGGLVIDLYPGEQHMDGEKAIQYVRYRDGEGDIGRIGRQQKFVKACLSQLISPDILPKLPELVKALSSAVETDMSLTQLLEYAQMMKKLHDNGLEAQMVPGAPAFLEDVSYWIPDITDLRELMVSELGLSQSEPSKERAQRDEDRYLKSLPENLRMITKSKSSETEAKEDDAKEQKEKEKNDEKPMKPEEISVLVINDSGINGAGAQVAEILQRKGFIISAVETGRTSERAQTVITTSSRNTDVFYGMPFDCIIMDGGSSNQAVIHIGLDYRKE